VDELTMLTVKAAALRQKQAYHGLEVLKSAFGNSKKPIAPVIPAPTEAVAPLPPTRERNKARDAARTLTFGNTKALASDFWNRMVAKYSKPAVEPYGEL